MASVTIKFVQRVHGRTPGDVTTVERTPFIDGLIKNGRVVVLGEVLDDGEFLRALGGDAAPVVDHVAILGVHEPVTNDLGQVLSFEAEVEQAVAEVSSEPDRDAPATGLVTEIPKPRPRPRRDG